MSISREELGRRLREAREGCGMTQEQVAAQLEVSRSTVAQMELGNRAVTGLELHRLAYLYGEDIRSFVAEEPRGGEEPFAALFRLHPELLKQDDVLDALRQCLALGRELTNLERLLGIDRDLVSVPAFQLRQPTSRWDAIQQGQRLADEERRRLGLGAAPLPDVAELLEAQGVRTAQVEMPDDISGLTLVEPAVGLFVAVNRRHHILRRRFSFAHETCHVLVDRARQGVVSRAEQRDELLEIRANAFAANFLMPDEAVQRFVHGLGKGHPSRMEATVFDGDAAVVGQARAEPGSQAIQLYDVVQIAHYFGVSRETALYRLKHIRLVTEPQLQELLAQDREGKGRELEALLDLPAPNHQAARNEFRRRFVGLALEAFRRDEISRAKLVELAAMVGARDSEVERAIAELDLNGGDAEVRIPGE